jgi:glycosyltransferase involved in cell wall biosynthesis
MYGAAEARSTVIIAHPGTQYSYETARALDEAGLLAYFLTGLYFSRASALVRMSRWMPQPASAVLERELLRRHADGLSDEKVRIAPLGEIIFLAAGRIGWLRTRQTAILKWRNQRFSRELARRIARERPAAVLCSDTYARHAFEAARRVGALCVLDQTIGDQRTGIKILSEEAALHPEFADTLQLEQIRRFADDNASEPELANLILAPSEFVRSTLIENGVDPSKVTIIPFGANTDRFYPVPRHRRERLRLLFVGYVSQRKGIKYLLEAMRVLNRRDLELVVVGNSTGGNRGLSRYRDWFTHVPSVANRQIHHWYESADIFVLPSVFEGSARVTYEALAAGLPVVTTPNSGSVVRDGVDGYVVPIRDVDALADRIARLADDPMLREQMGIMARERALEFTWARYRLSVAERIGCELERRCAAQGASAQLSPRAVATASHW